MTKIATKIDSLNERFGEHHWFLRRLATPLANDILEAFVEYAGVVTDAAASVAALDATNQDAAAFDQATADVAACDAARGHLIATVNANQDFAYVVDALFLVTFRGAIYREAERELGLARTAAIDASDSSAAADCYADRFVPARDAFLDAVLNLATGTVARSEKIVEELLNNA